MPYTLSLSSLAMLQSPMSPPQLSRQSVAPLVNPLSPSSVISTNQVSPRLPSAQPKAAKRQTSPMMMQVARQALLQDAALQRLLAPSDQQGPNPFNVVAAQEATSRAMIPLMLSTAVLTGPAYMMLLNPLRMNPIAKGAIGVAFTIATEFALSLGAKVIALKALSEKDSLSRQALMNPASIFGTLPPSLPRTTA